MSKGSHPRPFSVSNEEYAARWDAIFQRDLPKEIKNVNPFVDPITKAVFDNLPKTAPKYVQKVDAHPASLIEGIMSTETCGHPFCDCKDVCKEAK